MRGLDIRKNKLFANSTKGFQTFHVAFDNQYNIRSILMSIFENNSLTYNLRFPQMQNAFTMYSNVFVQTLPKGIAIF